ncbi:hypothetical protein EAD89_16450 [Micromonospora sp. BL4]|uniref:hypothetical protein n=1 Tax=Micromonospora sp. BL4 TaxID=2478710 RepID=UPI000EF61879|nr:hypothetical protein [Micromonospora sp. BL4]RLP88628.1 hypothetical protein EAD89_16450 [Micromonospora sp. BL4]
MTIAEDIVELLRQNPNGLSDAELAKRTGKLHQQVNQRCRTLAEQGRLVRDDSAGVIVNRIGAGATDSAVCDPGPAAAASLDATREWFWEGNVQARLCSWLVQQGWSLIQVMNTATRQQGTDIEACRGEVRLHVEVKGYPSRSYVDPRRTGEAKPTQASTQAGHWYAHALLKAVRLRDKHPHDAVAVAFPDFGRYRSLLAETQRSLGALLIDAFLVTEDGDVARWAEREAAQRMNAASPSPSLVQERRE